MRALVSVILGALFSIMATSNDKKASANGMTVEWYFLGEEIVFKMRAPHTGWVAIGLNTSENLTGTNLIMGSVKHGRPTLSDRTILRPGSHVPVPEKEGLSHVRLISAAESLGSTEIQFALKTKPADAWHFVLTPGQKFSLLMAFSESDDFMHHSRFRTSVWINL
jgi:hypothetical protein